MAHLCKWCDTPISQIGLGIVVGTDEICSSCKEEIKRENDLKCRYCGCELKCDISIVSGTCADCSPRAPATGVLPCCKGCNCELFSQKSIDEGFCPDCVNFLEEVTMDMRASNSCRICNRQLYAPESMERGYCELCNRKVILYQAGKGKGAMKVQCTVCKKDIAGSFIETGSGATCGSCYQKLKEDADQAKKDCATHKTAPQDSKVYDHTPTRCDQCGHPATVYYIQAGNRRICEFCHDDETRPIPVIKEPPKEGRTIDVVRMED